MIVLMKRRRRLFTFKRHTHTRAVFGRCNIYKPGCGTVSDTQWRAVGVYKEVCPVLWLCCMKGEKVSTPLDKDGIGPCGLQHIYG